ncbi:MAG: DUF349 domain-containing protein [Prevotellaceae bacterium]|jgi:hypothetical protein|nr:DUF349 domain-containing protein [Prevotellaceae bacterium]
MNTFEHIEQPVPQLENAPEQPSEPTQQPVVEVQNESEPTEPVVEILNESEPTEPVVEILNEEEPTEPVVEILNEEEPAEPVAEIQNESEPTEPVAEILNEEEPTEPVVEIQNEDEPAEPVADIQPEVESSEPEASPQSDVNEDEPTIAPTLKNAHYHALSLQELIAEMSALLQQPVEEIKSSVEAIKQVFYIKLNNEFPITEENDSETPNRERTGIEVEFKALLGKYKELKAVVNATLEAQREQNLQLKRNILNKLEELTNATDDLSATIPAFRKLQQEWKAIGQVPQTKINEIWKSYSHYQEKFYDLIKISNDLREYDFKKNLELKTALCEIVERLEEEQNAVKAFQALQKLHDEWREIGPVAREEREPIWTRFKEASALINKKHQAYFESLKEKEAQNLAAKTALCEAVEKIDIASLQTRAQWDAKSAEIIEYQNQWKTIGQASRKVNTKIHKRFRNVCDTFFQARNNYHKTQKEELRANYDKKLALCLRAEALKEGTERKEAIEKLQALQAEWKNIGAVPRKHTDVLWKRFRETFTYFFENTADASHATPANREENLRLKQEIIATVDAFVPTGNGAADMIALKDLVRNYSKIGAVPTSEKQRVNDAFRAAADAKFESVRSAHRQTGNGRTGKPSSERTKLLHTYNALKNEIKTYENNIGFLTASSKKGNTLVEGITQQVEKLKKQLNDIADKIGAL